MHGNPRDGVVNAPAKKARAWMNVDTSRAAVVLVLNRRGGTIGERVVSISFTPPAIRRAKPTTRVAMVCESDPVKLLAKNPR